MSTEATSYDATSDTASTGSSEAPSDSTLTSRLPPIRRHDENQPGANEATAVRSADETTRLPAAAYSAPSPAYPPASAYSPPAAAGAPMSRYQAPTNTMLADQDDDEPLPRRGPGFASALGIAGITVAAMGLYALPIQQESGRTEVLFGQLRSAAAFTRVATIQGDTSTSLAGGQLATTFWRYGALGVIGGLALLVILTFAWAPLRLAGGILTFLGAVGALVYLGLAAHETNKFETAVSTFRADRMAWGDWKIGFWVGAGGMVLIALSGLVAVGTRKR